MQNSAVSSGREVLSSSSFTPDPIITPQRQTTSKSTKNFNLHQRNPWERELISPTPKIASEKHFNDSNPPSRARHRRTRNNIESSPSPLPTTKFNYTNDAQIQSDISSTLPPLIWKQTTQQLHIFKNAPSITECSNEILITSKSTDRLPQIQSLDVSDKEPELRTPPLRSSLQSQPYQPINQQDSVSHVGVNTLTSPTPRLDNESTILALSALNQHHTKIEESLGYRLTLLKAATHILMRNGGHPTGITHALEYLLTCGDVGALVDVAKAILSISEEGDCDRDAVDEMDASDYVGLSGWLNAVPVMMRATNPFYVLVGVRVLNIILPVLEQWFDDAIGIAQSLGSDSIPDELRSQCRMYNETCRGFVPIVDGIERKGRLGVVANEAHQLLSAFVAKSIP